MPSCSAFSSSHEASLALALRVFRMCAPRNGEVPEMKEPLGTAHANATLPALPETPPWRLAGKSFPSAYLEFPCDNLTLLLLVLSSTSR